MQCLVMFVGFKKKIMEKGLSWRVERKCEKSWVLFHRKLWIFFKLRKKLKLFDNLWKSPNSHLKFLKFSENFSSKTSLKSYCQLSSTPRTLSITIIYNITNESGFNDFTARVETSASSSVSQLWLYANYSLMWFANNWRRNWNMK